MTTGFSFLVFAPTGHIFDDAAADGFVGQQFPLSGTETILSCTEATVVSDGEAIEVTVSSDCNVPELDP